MKINGNFNPSVPSTGVSEQANTSGASETQSKKRIERAPQHEAAIRTSQKGRGDDAKTEISDRGRELARVKAQAAQAPDVREDRIAELKKKIADGTYRMDAEKVADRLVDEHLSSAV